MVLDIDNQLLWSRLTNSLTDHPTPNPTTSIPNTNVRSAVCFTDPPLQLPSEERDQESQNVDSLAVRCEPDAEDPDPASIAPERSSVLSRQVGIVRPPVGRRFVLSPRAHVFRPRADCLPPSGTVHPSVNVSRPPAALRVPLVEQDDTLMKTRVGPTSVFSMESTDLSVPPHLQDLFDKSVTQSDLAPSHQCSLAALMRRHSDAFAAGPMDLGFCDVLEHDIDTGDAEPIRQPPRRPTLSTRQAEEDILNEMLQTGVIEPSNSPWPSPVCMVRKKDGSYRYRRGLPPDELSDHQRRLPSAGRERHLRQSTRRQVLRHDRLIIWILATRHDTKIYILHKTRTLSVYPNALRPVQRTSFILSVNADHTP